MDVSPRILMHGLAAPAFELPAAGGSTVGFPDPVHAGLTLLVFYRGHWCPYCRRYLAKIQQRLADFRRADIRVIAISPEPPETAAALQRELGLKFPLACDNDGTVIDAYAVRNRLGSCEGLLPHPAVVLVNASGRIALRQLNRNYKKRTPMRRILQAAELAAISRLPVES